MEELNDRLSENIDAERSEVEIPEVKLPGSNGVMFSNPDIEKALKKEKITNAALEETEQIEHPAYLIDLSNIYSVLPCTLKAIKCMLLDNVDMERLNAQRANNSQPLLKVDTALYFMTDSGLKLIGHGDGYMFYKQLDSFIQGAFGEDVKIYKSLVNEHTGEITFGEAKSLDVSQVVLRLDI